MRKSGGIFTKLKLLMAKNRLGELLVIKGILTPQDLHKALRRQKQEKAPLGRILREDAKVKRRTLYSTLMEQWALRFMATCMSFMLLFSVAGIKEAKAASIKDIPPSIKLTAAANSAFSPMTSYPALFGTKEKRSYNIEPFTKWTGMFDRFEKAVASSDGRTAMSTLQADLAGFQGLALSAMARSVNKLINAQRYITDSRNWGKSDYWATPVEFFTRGGDCEDFAIAKYVSLRALGVPEERLRVAIVHDKIKDIPHAVLIVYTDQGALILDNQDDKVLDSRNLDRYRPIFSINRQAWWLHTQPSRTVLASAK